MVNTNLKLVSILTFTLIGIQLVGACSIAVPDFTYLGNIHNTSDPNLFIIDIRDDNYNTINQALFNIVTGSLIPLGDQVFLDRVVETSDYKYESSLTNAYNDTRIVASSLNDVELFDISLKLEGSFVFDLNQGHFFMVSEKLNLAYIGFPYNVDSESSIDADFGSLFIVPLDNPSNVTFTYTISSYYFWTASNYYNLYDDYGIVMMPGQGADCNGGTYVKFNETGFEVIKTMWAGTYVNFDPEYNRIISISTDWQSDGSKIEIYDYKLDSSFEFFFLSTDIDIVANENGYTTITNTDDGTVDTKSNKDNTSAETLDLPFAAVSFISSLFALVLMKRKKLN